MMFFAKKYKFRHFPHNTNDALPDNKWFLASTAMELIRNGRLSQAAPNIKNTLGEKSLKSIVIFADCVTLLFAIKLET